jgi:hypothetical protein
MKFPLSPQKTVAHARRVRTGPGMSRSSVACRAVGSSPVEVHRCTTYTDLDFAGTFPLRVALHMGWIISSLQTPIECPSRFRSVKWIAENAVNQREISQKHSWDLTSPQMLN